MKVTGSTVLSAPRSAVWAALNDPAVLVRTIPGCERLVEAGPDRYRMTVTAGVGSITGTYTGDVALRDQQEPSSFVMAASGAGAPGTVSADVRVTLADDGSGGTRLDYDADAIVGGMIGGVGQRMLAGVAKKTAGEFFAAVDDVLTGRSAAVTEAAASAAVTEAAASAAVTEAAAAAAVTEAAASAAVTEAAASAAEGEADAVGAARVYEAPPRPAAGPSDFTRGVLAGAAVALAGVALGGWLAGRARSIQ